MTRLLLFAALMGIAGYAAFYLLIAGLFVLGEPLPHGQHISIMFGVFGFVGPLILVCVHFATTHPDWTLRARRNMLRIYVATVLIAFAGEAPQLFFGDTRLQTAESMVKSAIWWMLCGAPIIAAWLNAVGDQRPE